MYQIKQANCVCCHNCANECPMQAINFLGAKYQIDPDKCVQCGLCAKVCHTCSIQDVDVIRTVPAHDVIEKTADVVVCGGGTGLVAAVRAAQEGKKVILVEKAEKVGGNTDYAHGFFPVYTRLFGEAGMPDLREQAIAHYRRVTDNVLEEDVLRTAVYGTTAFFDWLCDNAPVHDFYKVVDLGSADAHGPIYGPGLLDMPKRYRDHLNCRDDAIGPGFGGTFIKHSMLEAIEQQNLDVEILVATAARHLLLDDNGAICGVVCEDPSGEVRITAPAVLLQVGGFGKCDEKLVEFFPDFFDGGEPHRFSVPTDTGDAIDMLRELGVEPNPERMLVSGFAPKHHPYSNVLADLALSPEIPQFNWQGKRWINEADGLFAMTDYLLETNKRFSWGIHGRDEFALIAQNFINNPAFASKAYLYETWEYDVEVESKLPVNAPVKVADTLEEIAVACGFPVEDFLAAVKEYNAACSAGKDEQFGKDARFLHPIPEQGPYYAIYGNYFSEAAMGGVTVDGQCRVLRNDGTPIPGLYAGGDCTSAMHRRRKLAPISELTWAVASAYTSAINAVTYIDTL